MYKPQSKQKLITDSIQFFLSIESHVNIENALDTILLFDDLIKLHPNISINEPIKGHKFKSFIRNMYEKFDNVDNYTDTLPFMPYNIRNGIYSSILGLIAEYMSLVITKKYNGKLLQDNNNQLCGNDIEYTHNGHYITADIKLSSTYWTDTPLIRCHQDWFKKGKNSTRIHIVDIYNGIHIMIGRSQLFLLMKKYGQLIPVEQLGYNIEDIKSYTAIFRN